MEKMSEDSTQDHISDLPDSLLVDILSFLDMKDVVRTSVLSKRWQYIWTSVSTLTFVCSEVDCGEIFKFVTWVNTVLLRFQHMSIEKFGIRSTTMLLCCFTFEIDSWVQFAVDKKVGDLSLNFNDRGEFYILPQSVRCSSSLTNLSLRRCTFWGEVVISWPSLKSLSLDFMDLDDNDIEDILRGCPMLEFLKLFNCFGFDTLHIESKTLREVVIASEEYSEARLLKISAPNLEILHFYYADFSIWKVQLVDVSSLVRATLNFSHPYDDNDTLTGLFKSFCHVKALDLGVDFIQCICHDVFLSDARALSSKLSCLTHLKLSLCSGKVEGPGVIALLKCSPNLETLVVYSSDYIDTSPDFAKLAEEYWKLNRRIENFPLPHLKTVKFLEFTDRGRVDKYIRKLVKFLLKNAGHLGSITIQGEEYDMIYKLRAA